MKNILTSLIIVVVLAGCSGGPDKVTKTCNRKTQGYTISISGSAKSEKDDIDTVAYQFSVDYKSIGVDPKKLDQEGKEKIVDQLKKMFVDGIDKEIKVETKFNDEDVTVGFKISANEIESASNNKDESVSMDYFINTLKNGGFTCK